jgi:hypothetical protein
MKFWKRLRALATVAFILVLLGVWLAAEPGTPGAAGTTPMPRPAPLF